MPANARITQDPMKHGDPVAKRASIHQRKDEVVEKVKAKTSPNPNARKNVNPKGQFKIQKGRKARKVIGPKYREVEKAKRQGRKDLERTGGSSKYYRCCGEGRV